MHIEVSLATTPQCRENQFLKTIQELDGHTTVHFACDCGHRWQREMEAGLIAVACPSCGREHMTDLGRVFSHIASKAHGDE
jgi:hypothetical protein